MGMRSKSRLVLVVSLSACCLAVLLATLWLVWGRGNDRGDDRGDDPVVEIPARLPELTVSLGRRLVLTAPGRVGGDHYLMIPRGRNDLWVIVTSSEKLSWSRYDGMSWSDLKPIDTQGWELISTLCGTLDAEGNPVLIWAGFDEAPGEGLATIRWTGTGWSTPHELDRLETATPVGTMDCLLSKDGKIHLAYDRPLVPRERYAIGLVVVDGAFPSKCYHVVGDGKSWSRPQATSGPGMYHVQDLRLSIGPMNRVYLSVVVGPFSRSGGYEKAYVGYQTWDGERWGSLSRLTPKDQKAHQGYAVVDKWGTKHVGWADDSWSPHYLSIRPNRVSPVESLPDYDRWDLRQDALGRAVMVWSDRIRVWTGRKWAETAVPEISELAIGRDGTLYMVQWLGTQITMQEILVRETKG